MECTVNLFFDFFFQFIQLKHFTVLQLCQLFHDFHIQDILKIICNLSMI